MRDETDEGREPKKPQRAAFFLDKVLNTEERCEKFRRALEPILCGEKHEFNLVRFLTPEGFVNQYVHEGRVLQLARGSLFQAHAMDLQEVDSVGNASFATVIARAYEPYREQLYISLGGSGYNSEIAPFKHRNFICGPPDAQNWVSDDQRTKDWCQRLAEQALRRPPAAVICAELRKARQDWQRFVAETTERAERDRDAFQPLPTHPFSSLQANLKPISDALIPPPPGLTGALVEATWTVAEHLAGERARLPHDYPKGMSADEWKLWLARWEQESVGLIAQVDQLIVELEQESSREEPRKPQQSKKQREREQEAERT